MATRSLTVTTTPTDVSGSEGFNLTDGEDYMLQLLGGMRFYVTVQSDVADVETEVASQHLSSEWIKVNLAAGEELYVWSADRNGGGQVVLQSGVEPVAR